MGQKSAELFATSSDFLRLWEVKEGKLSSKVSLFFLFLFYFFLFFFL